MPELPEVEVYRRGFERNALGRTVVSIELTDRRILHHTSIAALRQGLSNRTFRTTARHGKHFFAGTDGPAWLYLHFGMSGDLHYDVDPPRFSRLILRFADGGLAAFEDMRLFGRVGVVRDPDQFLREHHLGPDPTSAEFDADAMTRVLDRKAGVKAILMNQDNIAGLGNLWVDEILFQTSVHPRTLGCDLSARTKRLMFTTMRRILASAVERQDRGQPYPRTWLIEQRIEGGRCPRCGGTLARSVVAGRTTCFCRDHQRRRKAGKRRGGE